MWAPNTQRTCDIHKGREQPYFSFFTPTTSPYSHHHKSSIFNRENENWQHVSNESLLVEGTGISAPVSSTLLFCPSLGEIYLEPGHIVFSDSF